MIDHNFDPLAKMEEMIAHINHHTNEINLIKVNILEIARAVNIQCDMLKEEINRINNNEIMIKTLTRQLDNLRSSK